MVAGLPLYLGLQGEVEGQSHVLVEAQGPPGPAHLNEVVQLAGVHGHVRLLECAALTLDPDVLFVAPGHDQQQDVQAGGVPGVDPCLDAGGRHPLDLVAHAPGRFAGAGGLDQGLLLSLSVADAPDPGVHANGPSPELLPLGGGPNPGPRSKGDLGPLPGEIVLPQGPANAPNLVRCLEDTGQTHTHPYLARGGPNLPRRVVEDQNRNPSLWA